MSWVLKVDLCQDSSRSNDRKPNSSGFKVKKKDGGRTLLALLTEMCQGVGSGELGWLASSDLFALCIT